MRGLPASDEELSSFWWEVFQLLIRSLPTSHSTFWWHAFQLLMRNRPASDESLSSFWWETFQLLMRSFSTSDENAYQNLDEKPPSFWWQAFQIVMRSLPASDEKPHRFWWDEKKKPSSFWWEAFQPLIKILGRVFNRYLGIIPGGIFVAVPETKTVDELLKEHHIRGKNIFEANSGEFSLRTFWKMLDEYLDEFPGKLVKVNLKNDSRRSR